MPLHDHPPIAPWQERLLVNGFTPLSSVDWPGMRAATVFLRGCPWRCTYCHNPQLQRRKSGDTLLGWPHIVTALRESHQMLDAVVFSGGEPTADACLGDALAEVHALGFKTGLHTGGAYPDRLTRLLPLLDWVGFDLKTDYVHYAELTGTPGSGARATQSARLIVASGVDHEFRLTWHHQLIAEESALLAAHFAHELGARRFVLQEYRREGVTNAQLPAHSPLPAQLVERIRLIYPDLIIRGEICGLAPG
ncbi:MAG: anaerobic ribonucleoside-triphosphate reductase activating protein [Candidatus Dactylopiibacterium carminicum]|nr:MAG: anaerobic ribonucleoside-triphosphate reductase activating protein [Candidatus Dactylopiibacterium carminicum]